MKADFSSEPETRNQKPEPPLGEFITRSAQETFALAKRIGDQLKGGEVFLLKGELGTGKTVFAKGLAAGLDIPPESVTSPSFTLINVHDGRLRFYHIDLYRLENASQRDLGLEEILDDDRSVVAIEWAERLEARPQGATDVRMFDVSGSTRRVKIVVDEDR